MARDLDDMVHERIVARICGRPVRPFPNIEAADLLAPDRSKQPPAPHEAYRMPDTMAVRGEKIRAESLRNLRSRDTMQRKAASDLTTHPRGAT